MTVRLSEDGKRWAKYYADLSFSNHQRACQVIRELVETGRTDGKPRPPADDDDEEPDCCLPDFRVTK